MPRTHLIARRLLSNLTLRSGSLPRILWNPQPCLSLPRNRRRSSTSSDGPKTSQGHGSDAIKQSIIYGSAALLVVVYATYTHRSSTSSDPKIFDAPRFTPFKVLSRDIASPSSIFLTLRPTHLTSTPKLDPYVDLWSKGTWSVEFKQPQLQIARSYTPLPPSEYTINGDLRFLIRKEHMGEVSGYLHGLDVGAKVELRGPELEIELPKEVEEVVFLAGGTGIAPALQVIHTLLETKGNRNEIGGRPRIHIIWANRRRADCEGGHDENATLAKGWSFWKRTPVPPARSQPPCIIVKELHDLQRKHEGHVFVDYVVDEEGTFIDQKKIRQITQMSSDLKSGPVHDRLNKRLIFVSGPEGFVNAFAGPKKWVGGKEVQGKLGGVLGRMRLEDWKVYKL